MKKLFFIFSILSLSGCATVFTGTTQTVSIKVEEADTKESLAANCTVTDSNGGQHSLAGNPGVITVARGFNPLTVSCRKKGYTQLNTMVGSSFHGATLVNILFWPGFLVDGATGACKKYPSHYVVNMEKNSVAQ